MSQDNEEAREALDQFLEGANQRNKEEQWDHLSIGGQQWPVERVIAELTDFLSGNRKERIEEVLAGRTYQVATVVEGLVNTGNVSAVMRTAEGLGFQPFHLVKNAGQYKRSERISHGAEKWLDVWQWDDPATCAQWLKSRGYQIAVTHLDENATPLADIDFTQKTALVLGNEAEGVTDEMLKQADLTCYIPIPGFTQSFNISVAAAVSLYHAFRDRVVRQGYHGDLNDVAKRYLRAVFYYRSAQSAEQILKRKFESNGKGH